MSHPLVELARTAIAHYLGTGRLLEAAGPPGDPPRPVFVSIHEPAGRGEQEGRLRGCRGSLEPQEASLQAEVIRQAVLAAVDDPRFEPVRPSEVEHLELAVYLLGRLEPVEAPESLDPARYGVLVEGGTGRSALLLPGLPGIDDADHQLALARRKARLEPTEPVRLFRFGADVLR